MTDEIIKELWRIKDDIAREHSDDLDRLVADLRVRTYHGNRFKKPLEVVEIAETIE